MKRSILLCLTVLNLATSLATAQTWMPMGPDGGTIKHFALAPSSPSVLYVGSDYFGSVFKSTNGGQWWHPVDLGVGETSILALTVDPTNSSTVYTLVYTAGDFRLYKSTDGALTWVDVGVGISGALQLIEIDPLNPSVLYLSANTLYRSTDGGMSWAPRGSGLPGRPEQLTIDPTDPQRLFVVVEGDVYRSADAGASWTAAAVPPDDISSSYDLIVSRADPSVLLTSSSSGVFKSSDGGVTWASTGWDSAATGLAIHPTLSTTIYAGTFNGLIRSTDGGATWNLVSDNSDTSHRSVTIDPIDPNTIYTSLNGDAGVLKTTDGGVSWSSASRGLRAHFVQSLALAPNTLQTLYAAANADLYRSADGGASWAPGSGLPRDVIFSIEVDPSAPSKVYAAYHTRLYRSSDGGTTWLSAGGAPPGVYDLEIAPSNPATLYAAGSTNFSVARSTDSGDSWTFVNSGLGGAQIEDVAVDPLDASIIYAVSGTDFFRSFDGGDSWTAISNDISGYAYSVEVDPVTPTTLYIGTGHLHKSIDRGDNWTPPVSPNPPYIFGANIYSFGISPSDPLTIYVASNAGVTRTRDGGATLQHFNDGLSINQRGRDILVHPDDPLVAYVATEGASVYTTATTLWFPGAVVALSGQSISLPLALINAGSDLVSVAFSIDYDESCLSFDPTDANGDSIPDAINFQVPAGYSRFVSFDPGDFDGEIDVVLTDPSGTLPLSDGTLANVSFVPTCPPAPGESYSAGIGFSSDPAASFSNSGGQPIPGNTTAGFVEIQPAPPSVVVHSPQGGDRWPLGSTQTIRWSASDDAHICRVEVELLYSTDDGATYLPATPGGGLPAVFDQGDQCSLGIDLSQVLYTVPANPPSGVPGSLYRVEISVTDFEGYEKSDQSEDFFVVDEDLISRKTLILTSHGRLAQIFGTAEADRLVQTLEQLANHPQVEGEVFDLEELASARLYDAWAADPGDSSKVNELLFADGGVQDGLFGLLADRADVEYLILAGDDRIVPMARLADHTVYPESAYTAPSLPSSEAELLAGSTTVGRALAADEFLSDDPLAMLRDIDPADLALRPNALDEAKKPFLPDLVTGRLVETPEEIRRSVALFLSLDGTLDLTERDNKVLVSGYDFLTDSAKRIRQIWQDFYPSQSPTSPVNGTLFGNTWDEEDLQSNLCGNGGLPYGIQSLNGHATHYEAGVPGLGGILDIQGVDTTELVAPAACGGGPLRLDGAMIYSGGCHEGLPVAGTSDPLEHPLDLPQAFLSLGALAYTANTGYGWGLLCGVGYSERLVLLLTEELARGSIVVAGEAVLRAKQRYHVETPYFDIYDHKTSLQWTFYGFPMYQVHTGATPGNSTDSPLNNRTPRTAARPALERQGPVTIRRQSGVEPTTKAFHEHLTSERVSLDFGADTYSKFFASGEPVPDGLEGCPVELDPGSSAGCSGCYYTLNGFVERSTGIADLPIQPYFIYNSTISGTRQRDALWLGGSYEAESGWVPLFADLVSNGGNLPNHGVAPRKIFIKPRRTATRSQNSLPTQQVADEENRLVVTVGEVVDDPRSVDSYEIERLYRQVELEIFYLGAEHDDTCDRERPAFNPSTHDAFHTIQSTVADWHVDLIDTPDVERVVVIYDDESQDRWVPLELTNDGGIWRGSLEARGQTTLTYLLQAVDRCGNVGWLEYDWQGSPPASESGLVLVWPVEDVFETADVQLVVTLTDTPDPAPVEGTVLYQILVENHGTDPATSVVVTEPLPTGTGYLAADGDGWDCGSQGGVVECQRDRLGPGTAAPPIQLFVTAPSTEAWLETEACARSAESAPVCSLQRTRVLTDPGNRFFYDGFESGDCSAWLAAPACG